MQIIRDVQTLRQAIFSLRSGKGESARIALVPTMGALHDGHMSLIREAMARADFVVTSIFVNPTQFGPNEDLDAYPRQEAQDAAKLEQAGVSILWAPSVAEMYPDGFATNISVSGISEGLCGAARPGHFDGVATVVAKLFNQVQPDLALFGEKDYQQLAIIRQLTRDLDLPIEIVGVPTLRAEDGLALSSRNAYLSPDERAKAVVLSQALQEGAEALRNGQDAVAVVGNIVDRLVAAGFKSVDYVELCDAVSLKPVKTVKSPTRLLAAARMGTTRLIDNIEVKSIQ